MLEFCVWGWGAFSVVFIKNNREEERIEASISGKLSSLFSQVAGAVLREEKPRFSEKETSGKKTYSLGIFSASSYFLQ
jgi:hypothetical protein